MKIVVVEDSNIVRKRMVGMLNEIEGVEVEGEAETVQKALELLGRLNPDLVMLDIQMPDGSGMDVLKEMNQEGTHSTVIVMTNHPYPQYRERCKKLGADYFFDKSSDMDKAFMLIGQLAGCNVPYALEVA